MSKKKYLTRNVDNVKLGADNENDLVDITDSTDSTDSGDGSGDIPEPTPDPEPVDPDPIPDPDPVDPEPVDPSDDSGDPTPEPTPEDSSDDSGDDSGDTPTPPEPTPVPPTPEDSSDDSSEEDHHHEGDPTEAGYYIQVNEYALEDAKFTRVTSRLNALKVNYFVTATGIILVGPYSTEEIAITARIHLIRKGLKGRIIYYEI